MAMFLVSIQLKLCPSKVSKGVAEMVVASSVCHLCVFLGRACAARTCHCILLQYALCLHSSH